MTETRKEAEKIIAKALAEANEEHELFHSLHEGYAVLHEEVDEAEYEMRRIENLLVNLWVSVKQDDAECAVDIAARIKSRAIDAIAELAQVGAMAEKIIISEEARNE